MITSGGMSHPKTNVRKSIPFLSSCVRLGSTWALDVQVVIMVTKKLESKYKITKSNYQMFKILD